MFALKRVTSARRDQNSVVGLWPTNMIPCVLFWKDLSIRWGALERTKRFHSQCEIWSGKVISVSRCNRVSLQKMN